MESRLFLEETLGRGLIYKCILYINMSPFSGLIASQAWNLTWPGMRAQIFITSSIVAASTKVGRDFLHYSIDLFS